jgi:hypothetical protein
MAMHVELQKASTRFRAGAAGLYCAVLRLAKQALKPDAWTQALLSLFHHIHHTEQAEHEVHHCGGEHAKVDPEVDYKIEHCPCGKHRIDKELAIGHATGGDLDLLKVHVRFKERCPSGGWHIESGEIEKVEA